MRQLAILASLCLSTGLITAQQIVVAEGLDANSLSIRLIDELQPAAAAVTLLDNVSMRGIQITGRSVGDELDGTRSRWADSFGIQRIELPGGGRLIRYERNDGALWGLLHIAADGATRSVLELPAPNAQPALPEYVGVNGPGSFAAIAGNGPELHVIRLDGSNHPSTGVPARAVATAAPVVPNSVTVGRSHAWFVTTDSRIWRLSLADGSLPVDCTPTNAPSTYRLKEELAAAGDGSSIAFLCGDRDLLQIYHLGETGTPVAMALPPSSYGECDYLPLGSGHPSIKLNEDGTRLFVVDEVAHDEFFLLDTTGTLPNLHITQDAIFEPTIGIHIMPMFLDQTLIVSIGRIDLMDWFRVTLNTLGGEVVNLTGTGALTQPFPQGSLVPAQAGKVGGKMIAVDGRNSQRSTRLLDIASGTSSMLATGLTGAARIGHSLGRPADIYLPGASSYLLSGIDGSILASLPTGLELTPPVHSDGFSATWLSLSGGFGLPVIYLDNGMAFGGNISPTQRQLITTSAGNLLLVGPSSELLTPTGGTTLPAAPAVRVFLSGAGA